MTWTRDERFRATAAPERPESAGARVRLHRAYKVHRIGDTGVVGLAGVDLEIHPGEFLAIVGPSDTGKSTVLHLLGGLDRASAGVVEVDGQDLGLLSDAELTRFRADRVGFVWQGAARNLVPYLTARQNVGLPRAIAGRTRRVRRDGSPAPGPDDLLAIVGLADRATHTPNELSGGEQQRAAIAVALADDPALLLADEPTAELDGEASARVLDVFHDISRDLGATVVMATHDLLAARRADRVVYLHDGRVRHAGIPIDRIEDDGRVRLPQEAAFAIADAELEVDVGEDEIRIRRRSDRGHG
jgi:ABC-type lipoprotein export system ATPase subunit